MFSTGSGFCLQAVELGQALGITIGTPGYMSPEQARGQRALGPGADVFGLGCLLYECITGQPAFSGTIAQAVIAKILFAEPAPLRQLCGDAPVELARIVEQMLCKAPARRFASCVEVLAPTAAPAAVAHCMVLAARGALEDTLDPPTPEQVASLDDIASEWTADIEVFATGAVAAHLHGAVADAAQRAASCALAMRRILPGWSSSVTTPQPDAATAVDRGTALLAKVVLTDIFGGGGPIAIEPGAQPLLDDAFEVDISTPDEPRLVGERKRR